MKIIPYILKFLMTFIIYYIVFIFIYFNSIKYNILPKSITELLHYYKYAPSLSFIFLILIPIIFLPNIILILNRKKKLLSFRGYIFVNNTIILFSPVLVFFILNINIFNPIFYNFCIVQIFSLCLSILIYFFKKNFF